MHKDKICTCDSKLRCKGCTLQGKLKCRYNPKEWVRFLSLFSLFLIPGLIGMIRRGYGQYILGYFLFWILFFFFWEIKILCSHCPFYAKEGFLLECLANNKCPKIWPFNPAPMSLWEKIQLIIGFMILFGYPIFYSLLGKQYLIAVLSVFGGMIFAGVLIIFTCSKCINFSCPFNRIPKELVKLYLDKNPVMKEAWKEDIILKTIKNSFVFLIKSNLWILFFCL